MRLTRVWFWLSDIFAWLLLSVTLLGACFYPIVGPVADRMDHQPTSWLRVVLASLFMLLIAITCFGITRRSPLAILFLVVLAFAVGISANLAIGLIYAGLVLLIFGIPLLLAFLEARSRLPAQET